MTTEANGSQAMQVVDDELDAFPSNGDARATTGLDALARSEIDVQVATAHRYPRNVRLAVKRAEEMAILDEETAASCFYVLPRDGKNIEGPSVRLAEIFASTWGNLRAGSRIIDEGEKFLVAQGFCHDLETNNAFGAEVAQRITNKTGKKYNDDMIGTAAAAAQAKAYRNAVFKVVPRAFVNKVMRKAKAVAVGDASSLVDKRAQAIVWFQKATVSVERILAKLGRASVEEIDLDDLATLLGLSTAIRDRMITPDAAFPPVQQVTAGAPAQPSKPADVAAHVAAVAAQAEAQAKAAEAKAQATAQNAKPAETPEEKKPEPSDAEKAIAIEKKLAKSDLTLAQLGGVDEKIAELPDGDLKTTLAAKAKARRDGWGK